MRFLMLRRRVPALDALAALATRRGHEDVFHWERPEEQCARLGLGRLETVHASGADRFERCARAVRRLLHTVEVRGDGGSGAPRPQVFGGFAYSDCADTKCWPGFPSAEWVLPERMLVRESGATWLAALSPLCAEDDPDEVAKRIEPRLEAWRQEIERSAPVLPSDLPLEHRAVAQPAPAEFTGQVRAALRAIAAGELEKVVLARSVTVSRPGGFHAPGLLASLRRALPTSATFFVARGETSFLGATPERLLRRSGERLDSVALAGTAARGRNPEEDRRLGRELVESKKEQAEHAVVLRFLRARLAGLGAAVENAEAPTLARLEGLQHLATPIRARLAEDVSLLEIAGHLHPTPATGGAPSDAARRWLSEHENLERGWYAGPIGWCDALGDGELWVALRCGLLRGESFQMFAGAGVVAGSDPDAELRETRLKLGTLLTRVLEV